MSLTHLLRSAKAAHQPDWPSLDLLRDVLAELYSRAGLVDLTSCEQLRLELARAAAGERFIVQIGDCAERFGDATPAVTRCKAANLDALADRAEALTGVPAVRVGRIAGQYAKPRSRPVETLDDGTQIPAYFGDAVNAESPTVQARTPDPLRLLDAYHRSADILAVLAERTTRSEPPIFTSHEALLLEYEESLVRTSRCGRRYGSSAHLLWVGERTRQLDHDHIDFLRGIDNPVAVKIGPTIDPEDARELAQLLNPDGRPGRLTFITRMGATHARDHLRRVLDGLTADATPPITWLVDPMHGNTVAHRSGRKTRVVADLLTEITHTATVLRDYGYRLAGVHLETTPDPVTECLDEHAELTVDDVLTDYRSACDPRLTPRQAMTVIEHATAAAQPLTLDTIS